jgi:hypothetical protein
MRRRTRAERASARDIISAQDTSGPKVVEVPVVLPHVVFAVQEDETVTVTVDGAPFEPEPFAPPWQRGSFPSIIDALTDRRRTPIRVEVREVDGSVFTDIITPARHRTTPPEPPLLPAGPEPALRLVALHGDGYLAGEDVAVAVIVAHGDAGPDGTARGLLTPGELAHAPTGEVALIGRISHTVTIGHPA